MGKKAPKGSYEVGYGKPPKQTQFKKGQSGNPLGKKEGDTKPRRADPEHRRRTHSCHRSWREKTDP